VVSAVPESLASPPSDSALSEPASLGAPALPPTPASFESLAFTRSPVHEIKSAAIDARVAKPLTPNLCSSGGVTVKPKDRPSREIPFRANLRA